jgi:hypothetical protein
LIAGTIATTYSNGVFYSAGAIFFSGIDIIVASVFVRTSMDFCTVTNAISVDISRAITIAYADGIHCANAGVNVITNAIVVGVCGAVTSALTQGVQNSAAVIVFGGGRVIIASGWVVAA